MRPGDRVLIWMRNRPELVEALIAGFKAGLTVVPVNLRLHPSEVAYILVDCQAGGFLYDETLAAEAATASQAAGSLIRFAADRLPDATPEGTLPDAKPEDSAWLFYTSGTTGKPKGATLTHRNLVAMAMNCLADVYSFQPEDVLLHAAPLTHGSGLYMLPALARGACNVISHHASFDPSGIFELIERRRVTVIPFLAPTMIVRLINDPGVRSRDLSSLRCAIYGGAPMYVEHIKHALAELGPIWVQVYGQGETPMTGTYLRREDHVADGPDAERRLGSIGIARTDLELAVVDPQGKPLPAGSVGEITVRGDTVMAGYWGKPEATAEALRGGWLHTGDLGYVDDNGYYFIVDRAKDMIISAGSNVYAREVEEALLTHQGVLEVAVIGVPDPEWGESAHAIVVPRDGWRPDADELLRHCRERIAAYKKPRSIEFVDDLPKNAYGKIVKRELRERRWSGHERQIAGGHLGT